ncbi:MAG: hypothetical protein CMP59_10120 [Flavobacteriales bacterium]|mgnify:CR=1 FL=1|nr:hypothetical protein [Flavobacteriales bacterium]
MESARSPCPDGSCLPTIIIAIGYEGGSESACLDTIPISSESLDKLEELYRGIVGGEENLRNLPAGRSAGNRQNRI